MLTGKPGRKSGPSVAEIPKIKGTLSIIFHPSSEEAPVPEVQSDESSGSEAPTFTREN